jgi:putative (di)nucleoside polyphosphate hydrolase
VTAGGAGEGDLALYRRNVGLMLIGPPGRVFAGERIDTPGAWQMPQGGVDPGEDVRAAALRELGEEVGVAPALVEVVGESAMWLRYDLPPDVAAKLWKGAYKGQAQRWFALRFRGTDADIRIGGRHAEFSAWDWLTPAALMERIVPFKRPVYEAVFGELGHLLD